MRTPSSPRHSLLLASLVAFAGCGPDLPAEWKGASVVDSFVQSECGGTPEEGDEARVSFTRRGAAIQANLSEARFRCEQEVEGFVKVEEGAIQFLVQPVDMNPSMVAGCDCLYNVTMDVQELAPDVYNVSLSVRGDKQSGQDEPTELFSEKIVVDG